MKNILLMLALAFLLSACSLNNLQSAKTNDSADVINADLDMNINTSVDTDITGKDVLDLSSKGLSKVDQSVFDKTNLLELNLSNNNLTGALPAEIRHLQKLRILNASNNQMTGVPAEIGQLSNLISLDLSNNQLTGLPYELGNLKNLKTLDLSGNNISQPDLDVIVSNLSAQVNIIR